MILRDDEASEALATRCRETLASAGSSFDAARALAGAMDRLPLADQTQLHRAIGLELSQTMGGSSGVLLAIFFASVGDGASGGLSMQDALRAGLARMKERLLKELRSARLWGRLWELLKEQQSARQWVRQSVQQSARGWATLAQPSAPQ